MATSSPGPSPRRFFKMADRLENRRGEGPGDEVAGYGCIRETLCDVDTTWPESHISM